MRIACLQFAPELGDVEGNLDRADAVLRKADLEGYNFKSLKDISPFLEPTTAGISSSWATNTALKYDCLVTVGYPESVDLSNKWPADPEYYNAIVTVDRNGDVIANYRKSFLYYTDETWALEGPDGFFGNYLEGFGKNVAMGICMDLNPYKFQSPWIAWEFAHHVLRVEANLVVLSMAWLTREAEASFCANPLEPDMDTLSYWVARLEPLIRAETEDEIIVIIANRCGVEEDAVYAGTSVVLGIHQGEVKVYGILGRGQRELLVVDTKDEPQAKLISAKQDNPAEETEPCTEMAVEAGGIIDQSTCSSANRVSPTNGCAPDDELQPMMDERLLGVPHLSPVESSASDAHFPTQAPNPKGQCNIESTDARDVTPQPLPTLLTDLASQSRRANRQRLPPVSAGAEVSGKTVDSIDTTIQSADGVDASKIQLSVETVTEHQTGQSEASKRNDESGSRRPKSTMW